MSQTIIINGERKAGAVISPANRSFRYGDGFFETIRYTSGKPELGDYHFDRFFEAATEMEYLIPPGLTRERLIAEMTNLVKENNCDTSARVRLTAWRGEGGLFHADNTLQYCIECWPLAETGSIFNEKGLHIGIYKDVSKSADRFSRFKNNHFYPYFHAARTATKMQWDDAIVLNTSGRVCDSCIANVFVVRDGKIVTPPLHEGPVAGVMRRHILQNFDVRENPVTIEELESADEIFLANSIRRIEWVRQLGDRHYTNNLSRQLYSSLLQTF